MIKYLVVLLDDSSVSFCHYSTKQDSRHLIPLEILRRGLFMSMEENWDVQFVFPDYQLPEEYLEMLETVNHTNIKPYPLAQDSDIVVFNDTDSFLKAELGTDKVCVLRISKHDLFNHTKEISGRIHETARLNIVLNDIESFNDDDFQKYEQSTAAFGKVLLKEYTSANYPQLNILSDRLFLDKMNNCGAGETTITLAPDGSFYICPAFYYATGDYALGHKKFSIGDVKEGIEIKNRQLYRLDHSPLCKQCDAFQCKRCVWLNRLLTNEVNIPSHEQCVIAHIERNATRSLMLDLKDTDSGIPYKDIKALDYLDPLDDIMRRK